MDKEKLDDDEISKLFDKHKTMISQDLDKFNDKDAGIYLMLFLETMLATILIGCEKHSGKDESIKMRKYFMNNVDSLIEKNLKKKDG